MKRLIVLTTCIVLAIVLTGCGAGTPSSSDIEKELIVLARPCVGDFYKIYDVNKTNGAGDKTAYKVDYTYKTKLLRTYDTVKDNHVECATRMLTAARKTVMARDNRQDFYNIDPNSGLEIEMQGSYVMIYSEKGWIFK